MSEYINESIHLEGRNNLRGRVIYCTLVITFILSLFTFQHKVNGAGDRFFSISNYNINVVINTDGSADIEERLIYDYSGQFGGALRDIDFEQTGGIADLQVYVDRDGTLEKFKINSRESLDADGQKGTFNYVKSGSLARLKIFEPSLNQQKTFVIKYKFLDVVTKYSDIAEFNRKLIGTGWDTKINNVRINVRLPQGAQKQELKVFAHGPLTGKSEILDGQNVSFTIAELDAETFLETLILFPTKLLGKVKNTVNEAALPRIMENERILAEQANKKRDEARQYVQEQNSLYEKEIQRRNNLGLIGKVLAILLIIGWFPIIIYIYTRYDKELKHSFSGKYYRELPGSYTPAEMSVLVFSGTVSARDLMATLMDLIRKKHLTLDTNKTHKKGLFGGKEITQYVISLSDKAPEEKLKQHEQYLIDWFINDIGDGMSVTFDEIKEYVKTRREALKFKSDFDKWIKFVKQEAEKNDFFNKTSKKGILLGVLSGIAYFIAGIAITTLLYTTFAIFLVLAGIILIGFSARIKKRTSYGNEHFEMWKAFRNFLKDFSRMDKAEVPSIVIWEHYLVYAISLGVAKEVIKQLPIVFDEGELNNPYLTYMYASRFGYFAGFTSMFNDTMHTVESSITTATNIANSANSSSSGGGGGFSGGSSGGGGGGGGGGAF